MNVKTTKQKVIPSKTDFVKWFVDEYWNVVGKFLPPTREELEELAKEIYSKLDK